MKDMPNTMAQICDDCNGFEFYVRSLTEAKDGLVRKSLQLPDKEEIIAFANAGKFTSGMAICESGIYWTNSASRKSAKNQLLWNELSGVDIVRKGMFDVSLGAGSFIETSDMGIRQKDLVALLGKLKQAVLANLALFPAPPAFQPGPAKHEPAPVYVPPTPPASSTPPPISTDTATFGFNPDPSQVKDYSKLFYLITRSVSAMFERDACPARRPSTP